jgi:cellulose synthase/poly-beta-1,6-N-acetylglucosamine synthase-like glycosyltransferase
VGKLHNLNGGIQAARGDLIALIDANTQMHAELWHAALAVMADPGIGAAFAPPVVIEPEPRGRASFPAGGEMLVALHTNHARTAELPLAAIYNRLRTLASGFIVLRRQALDEAGGMLHLLDEASEEVSLARVIGEAGYRIAAIPVPAQVVAEPKSVNDATTHLLRKLITLRATNPARFVGLLFANPLTVGSLLGFITEREGRWWGRRTWWVFVWLRLAVAYELDRIRFGRAFMWTAYAQLFMLDTFITPVLWARALVQGTVTWRGRTYRVAQGGKAERVE